MIKKNPVNKLFTIAVICCLTVSPVFASDEIKYEKDIIKAAKQNKVENTTTEYLDNIDMLIFKQAYQNEDFKKALKTTDYKVKVYETLYGKNSIQLRDAYFSKAELTLHAGLASEAEKAFIEAKKIAELTPKDNLLKEKINRIDEVKKNAFEYATESIKYINFRNETFTEKELSILPYLGQAGEVKNALKRLKNLENKAIKNKDNALLAKVYEQRINLLCETNNYKEMWNYVEKAEKLLPNFPEIKGTIDYVKVTYYREMAQYDIAREILNATSKNETDNDKMNYYAAVYNIEKDDKNFKEADKAVKKFEKFYINKYPEKSIQFTRMVYDKCIDLYKDMDKKEKTEEYLEKYREIVEPIKDEAPILYAKYLEKLGNYQVYAQDHKKAKDTLKLSATLYEKYEPKSHALASLYRDISSIEFYLGNNNEAIKYINKAIYHNLKHYSDSNKDLADYYVNLSMYTSRANDYNQAKIYLNKSVALYKNIYGENSIRTLNIEKEKYYFYQKYNKTENANKLIKYINKIIAEDKTIGSSKEFSQGIEFLNAVYYLDNEKYKEALTSIKKAEEFAYCDCQKREIYELKYSIYNALGNKAKAKKYKKLAKIED